MLRGFNLSDLVFSHSFPLLEVSLLESMRCTASQYRLSTASQTIVPSCGHTTDREARELEALNSYIREEVGYDGDHDVQLKQELTQVASKLSYKSV